MGHDATGMPAAAPLPRPAVPGVPTWRKRARSARRGHRSSPGETLTDLYTLLWFVLIYGGALYSEVSRHLRTAGAVDGQVERHWLGVAALLAGAGLAWRGLRSLGPMLATPAEQHWAVSSPMSRRRWLLDRFVGVLAGGAAVGAVASFAVVLLGIRSRGAGMAALGGAVYGALMAAAAVVAQGSARRRWPGALTAALLGAGGVTALGAIAAHGLGRTVPPPPSGVGPALLAAGAPAAALAVWRASAALPRLDRSRLGAGAQLAAAVVTSAVWMDVTVLGGVLEARRWRRVGWVRSRRPVRGFPGIPDRVWGLVQADVLRTLRRPGALGFWAALALAQYGIAVGAPSLAGAARVVLAYLAVGRLMSGLRVVARSDGLRRAMGGSEAALRAAHVVVPAAGALLWWAATGPTDAIGPGTAGLLLLAGVVAAAYRSATRGPVDYSKAIVEMGVSQLPVGLILQVARGPDLLGAVLVVRLFMT